MLTLFVLPSNKLHFPLPLPLGHPIKLSFPNPSLFSRPAAPSLQALLELSQISSLPMDCPLESSPPKVFQTPNLCGKAGHWASLRLPNTSHPWGMEGNPICPTGSRKWEYLGHGNCWSRVFPPWGKPKGLVSVTAQFCHSFNSVFPNLGRAWSHLGWGKMSLPLAGGEMGWNLRSLQSKPLWDFNLIY